MQNLGFLNINRGTRIFSNFIAFAKTVDSTIFKRLIQTSKICNTSEKIKSIFHPLSEKCDDNNTKVTIVGAGGEVGNGCAFCLLLKDLTNNLVLFDINKDKVRGQALDLQHGSVFLKNANIYYTDDYAETANSSLCIISAGEGKMKPGETRLDLLKKNIEIFKTLIPCVVKHSPNTLLYIVTNPVDIMTQVAWKLSSLPAHKVLGSGTNLDTARFRFLLSQKLGISPKSVNAYLIGEHGDSSVPVWSSVNVAGVRLSDIDPCFGTDNGNEKWSELAKQTTTAAYEVIKLKGFTSSAIALASADIVESIFRNTLEVRCVSTNCKNSYGFKKDLYMSVPCVLGRDGIVSVVELNLTENEIKKLKHSAAILSKFMPK